MKLISATYDFSHGTVHLSRSKAANGHVRVRAHYEDNTGSARDALIYFDPEAINNVSRDFIEATHRLAVLLTTPHLYFPESRHAMTNSELANFRALFSALT